jgi:hypothetical protein
VSTSCEYRKSDRRVFGIDDKHRWFTLNSAWTSIESSKFLNFFRPENEADEDSERGTRTALRFWLVFAPYRLVAASDGASRRLKQWIRCSLAPALDRSLFWRILGQRQVQSRRAAREAWY